MMYLVLGGMAMLASGCAEKSTWYDDSKEWDRVNSERVEQFKMQGMDQVKAQRTMTFETYWRNTEIGGRDIKPVEGNELKDALRD